MSPDLFLFQYFIILGLLHFHIKFWSQPFCLFVCFPAKDAGKFLIGALHQFRGELTVSDRWKSHLSIWVFSH